MHFPLNQIMCFVCSSYLKLAIYFLTPPDWCKCRVVVLHTSNNHASHCHQTILLLMLKGLIEKSTYWNVTIVAFNFIAGNRYQFREWVSSEK